MVTSPGTPTPASRPSDQAGPDLLLSVLEDLPAAVYCLGSAGDPVWANARARSMGATPADLPSVGGVRVADVVNEVLRTGRPRTLSGPLGSPVRWLP